jgi:hypothetical protein
VGRWVSILAPDGTELGVLAHYARPARYDQPGRPPTPQPDQFNIRVRDGHRRGGIAMQLLDKAAEAWGRDWLLTSIDTLLANEPESFSVAGEALWRKWSALARGGTPS